MIAQYKIVTGGGTVAKPGGERAVRLNATPLLHLAVGHHTCIARLARIIRATFNDSGDGNVFNGFGMDGVVGGGRSMLDSLALFVAAVNRSRSGQRHE
jgi:hypothetical protein